MTEQMPPLDAEQQKQFLAIEYTDGPAHAGRTGNTYTPDGEQVPETPEPNGDQFGGLSGAMVVGPLLALVFSILAERRGDHWRLTDAETEELGRTGGAVFDHYCGGGVGPFGAFAVTLSLAFAPRMMEERQRIAERKEQQKRREGSADGN